MWDSFDDIHFLSISDHFLITRNHRLIVSMTFINQNLFFYFITLSFIFFLFYFSKEFLMINCFDENDDLSNETFFSKRWDNCRRSNSQSFFMSSEKESKISTTETNRRIARKVCKQESVFKSFKNLKAMKAKTMFFDSDKSDLNINNCDERLFNLTFI